MYVLTLLYMYMYTVGDRLNGWSSEVHGFSSQVYELGEGKSTPPPKFTHLQTQPNMKGDQEIP